MTVRPKKVAVISHERSGTHFLMNAIALNCGYVARPWWNLDLELGINFHSAQVLRRYFEKFRDRPMQQILKSHHGFEFFSEFILLLLDEFRIFYIYRDPRDVMVSYWRMLALLPWDEGPKPPTASEFIRCAPRGAMLRYQKRQEPTVLHRWQTHVEGWVDFARSHPSESLMVLRYEDLNNNFEPTLQAIAHFLGQTLSQPQRPRKDENTVLPGAGESDRFRQHLSREDCLYLESVLGDTLQKLGYSS